MNALPKRMMIRIAIMAIAGIVAFFSKDKITGSGGGNNQSSKPAPQLRSDLNFDNSSKLVMKNMEIRDMDKSVAYQGDVDLAPTLARIKSGKRDKHNNDGSVFGNREGRLPKKPKGYYREYVVRTKNIRHAGPQRLVLGEKNEIYYTHDHYKSFRKIEP